MIKNSEEIKASYEKSVIEYMNKHEKLIELLEKKYKCYSCFYKPDEYNEFSMKFYPINSLKNPKVSINFQFSEDLRVLWPDYNKLINLLE